MACSGCSRNWCFRACDLVDGCSTVLETDATSVASSTQYVRSAVRCGRFFGGSSAALGFHIIVIVVFTVAIVREKV